MMHLLYNCSIYLLKALYFLASSFHPKAALFVTGRRNLLLTIHKTLKGTGQPTVWIHCASLGEFEQGRPVMELLKKNIPDVKIILTFFSPSGYEVRKNFSGVDHVFYLPLDTPGGACKFVELVNPSLAIFVKYEFWYNYTLELKKRNIPMISISCIFRPDQIFFRPYGNLFRKILMRFDHFFVQNSESVALLSSIGITATTLSGDTRFDRVFEITRDNTEIPIVSKFKAGEKVFVIGSCWPEDLDVLAPFINENQYRLKFIIAPHEIKEDFLHTIEKSIQVKTKRFSQSGDAEDIQVLLIDNVGMLSQLYRYGEFAYVGGGFGKGLHNILEAACYGIPIFFGNKNFEKFKEATDLVLRGGAFEIGNFSDLKSAYEMLVTRPENFLLACDVTREYVRENLGATRKIIAYCIPILRS